MPRRIEKGDDRLGLKRGEHGRAMHPGFSASEVGKDTWIGFENVFVEENNGVECLVLGGGGHFQIDSEVGQKCVNFQCAHFLGVAFVMEADEPTEPLDIGALGAEAVMEQANAIPDLVKEASWCSGFR